MSHDTLENWMKVQFSMINHHGWDGDYLEGLTPWVRTANVKMLRNHLDKLEEQRKKRG